MAEPTGSGPSNMPVDNQQDDLLQQAEIQFQQGIQAIRMADLDRAVELFGLVLQARCQQFGETDIRCASTYFRYGAALFYKAQDEQDVFGAPLQAAAAETADAAEAEETESEDEKENVDDKGKKPMREEDLPHTEGTGQDDEADESPGDRTDMELAWENLEVAKYIYEHDTGEQHAQELADIHSLLADIGMEQENFESALQDHKRALQLLDGILQADDRRLAELHYKSSLTLQYLDQPEDALEEIKMAVKLFETRIDSVKAVVNASATSSAMPCASEQTASVQIPQAASAQTSGAALPAASTATGGITVAANSAVAGVTPAGAASTPSTAAIAGASAVSSAENAEATKGFAAESVAVLKAEAARKELADLESVLEDMYEKVDELQQIVKEQVSTKNALKAAFSQIAGSLGGPSAGQGLQAGLSKAAAAPVVDLGVVGRGTKRVTPMPLPVASTSGPAITQAPRPAAKKRSFEDLMGGSSSLGSSNSITGTTTFGFGQSSSSLPSAVIATGQKLCPQPLSEPKKQKTGLMQLPLSDSSEKQQTARAGVTASAQLAQTTKQAALPAFLQRAQVAEAYGSNAVVQHEQK